MSEYIEVKITYMIPVVEKRFVWADFPDASYGWEDLDEPTKKALERSADMHAERLAEHASPLIKGLFPAVDGHEIEVPWWTVEYTIDDVVKEK